MEEGIPQANSPEECDLAGPSEHDCREQLAAAVSACAVDLAKILAGFLRAAGMSPEASAAALSEAAASTRRNDLSLTPTEHHVWVQLSDAVVMWWRDPDYLDDSGHPRDLPDAGPQPSLEALFERTVETRLRDSARDLLRRTAATEADGVWRLSRSDNSLALSGIECAQRLCMSVSGMLNTFIDNQLRLGESPESKNFDSGTHVSEFPVEKIPELRARLRKRLLHVLDDIDGWMTSTARRHPGGPVALVGVNAYMHTSGPRSRAESLNELDRRARRTLSCSNSEP